jgi:hypothetical protein
MIRKTNEIPKTGIERWGRGGGKPYNPMGRFTAPLLRKTLKLQNSGTPPLGTKKLGLLKLFVFLPKTVPLHESGTLLSP